MPKRIKKLFARAKNIYLFTPALDRTSFQAKVFRMSVWKPRKNNTAATATRKKSRKQEKHARSTLSLEKMCEEACRFHDPCYYTSDMILQDIDSTYDSHDEGDSSMEFANKIEMLISAAQKLEDNANKGVAFVDAGEWCDCGGSPSYFLLQYPSSASD